MDRFVAYEQFSERRISPGESVDVYVAELAILFGGISNHGLVYAFVKRLPNRVSRAIIIGKNSDEDMAVAAAWEIHQKYYATSS